MKTLILSNSHDVTTDIIVNRIGSDKVFRFNTDIYQEYSVSFSQQGLYLKSPSSSICEKQISKVYWRKPLNCEIAAPGEHTDLNGYVQSEIHYILREMCNYLKAIGKEFLVEPYAEHRVGKFIQMMSAAKYFSVPAWEATINTSPRSVKGSVVAKSASGEALNDDKVLYTTEVDIDSIDYRYPWFLQEKVSAEADVTVVYVRGKLFVFELDRARLSSLDWRKDIGNQDAMVWNKTDICKDNSNRISQFMRDLCLEYGRIDFLRKDGELYFLEVNPNGQWAWLDIKNEHGLISEIASNVSP